MNWNSVPSWSSGASGADQKTPDLKTIIQEIVDRGGWTSGNDIVIIVDGTGERTAYSWNGGSGSAPELQVNYAATFGTLTSDSAPLSFGSDEPTNGNYFDGILDEIRVSGSLRSADWISTAYNSQNSPSTFMSFSDQTAAGFGKAGAYGLGATRTSVYGTINDQALSAAITADAWNHVALSYDRSAGGTEELKLFVNGKLEATGDYATAIGTNANSLLLGDNYGFTGQMDEVRVLNYAKTAFGGGVVINTVFFGTGPWIDVYNTAGDSVDIRGWDFYNEDGSLFTISSSTTIPAGGTLKLTQASYSNLANLDSSDYLRVYDLDPDNDGTNENSAVYQAMVDFVAWGASPSVGDGDAVSAGLWTDDTFVSNPGGLDGVGLTSTGNNDEAVSDWQAIPEFPTLAVPVAAVFILGLMRRRRRRRAHYPI